MEYLWIVYGVYWEYTGSILGVSREYPRYPYKKKGQREKGKRERKIRDWGGVFKNHMGLVSVTGLRNQESALF
jgi:hypothetical protein